MQNSFLFVWKCLKILHLNVKFLNLEVNRIMSYFTHSRHAEVSLPHAEFQTTNQPLVHTCTLFKISFNVVPVKSKAKEPSNLTSVSVNPRAYKMYSFVYLFPSVSAPVRACRFSLPNLSTAKIKVTSSTVKIEYDTKQLVFRPKCIHIEEKRLFHTLIA